MKVKLQLEVIVEGEGKTKEEAIENALWDASVYYFTSFSEDNIIKTEIIEE